MKLILSLILALAVSTPLCSRAEDAPAKFAFSVKVTGKGKPIILIPGLSSSGAVWDGTVDHLKDHYQCHVLTLAGFAGEPSIKPPFLETVRHDLARYILTNHLNHPVIIGHSLGGFLALWLAEREPGLPGPTVIVDSLPFLPASMNPAATAETMKATAEQVRTQMSASTNAFLASSERAVKAMVTKPADVDLVMTWVKTTDPKTAAQAFYELFTNDLRPDTGKILAPMLVLGTWAGYKDYTTKDAVEATFHGQYADVKNCKIVISETCHFIMLDDPAWFYNQLDTFFAGPGKP